MKNRTAFCYNYRKLLGRIKEKFGTQEKFAKALDIGRVSLSQRLNGKLEFSQDEIYKSMHLLELDRMDIPLYFFQVDGNGVASWEEAR